MSSYTSDSNPFLTFPLSLFIIPSSLQLCEAWLSFSKYVYLFSQSQITCTIALVLLTYFLSRARYCVNCNFLSLPYSTNTFPQVICQFFSSLPHSIWLRYSLIIQLESFATVCIPIQGSFPQNSHRFYLLMCCVCVCIQKQHAQRNRTSLSPLMPSPQSPKSFHLVSTYPHQVINIASFWLIVPTFLLINGKDTYFYNLIFLFLSLNNMSQKLLHLNSQRSPLLLLIVAQYSTVGMYHS